MLQREACNGQTVVEDGKCGRKVIAERASSTTMPYSDGYKILRFNQSPVSSFFAFGTYIVLFLIPLAAEY